MDLLGGTGGLVEFKASLLASRGFAALALAYFGYDDLPSSPSPYVELDYIEEAAKWLYQHPKVIPGGIALHSHCMGTWLALLLASYSTDLVKAVVAVGPWYFAISNTAYMQVQRKVVKYIQPPSRSSKIYRSGNNWQILLCSFQGDN